MFPNPHSQLIALSDLLASRREAILAAWQSASGTDPEQTTDRNLTHGQFLDHIPKILNAFECRLRSRQGGLADHTDESGRQKEGVKDGLLPLNQGYCLKELMKECGQLQLCLFDELRDIASSHPELDHATFMEAFRLLLHLINDTIGESAVQYEQMQEAEAAVRVGDLMGALADISEIARRRASLLNQAVHDLSSDVLGVSIAASLASRTDMAETDRVVSVAFLQRAVLGLTSMLGELMDLARLEAGQEVREIARFDAGVLIAELCHSHQPYAHERHLFLKIKGTDPVRVEGDKERVRRVVKNLIGNALKHTQEGGVTVSWGTEKKTWWLIIKETKPGLTNDSDASIEAGVREVNKGALPLLSKSTGETPSSPPRHPHSEGIGLSIAGRLCELLDASLEIVSPSETGMSFRVIFPRRYDRRVSVK